MELQQQFYEQYKLSSRRVDRFIEGRADDSLLGETEKRLLEENKSRQGSAEEQTRNPD